MRTNEDKIKRSFVEIKVWKTSHHYEQGFPPKVIRATSLEIARGFIPKNWRVTKVSN